MKAIIDYLTSNKEWLTLVVNILLGVSTIIATCVNAYLVSKQNEIYKEQMTLQEKQNQPIFSISTQLEQDLDDGKFGTEIFTIHNVGQTMSQPCQVSVKVFFRIVKAVGKDRDSTYIEIGNYFTIASKGNTGENEVYYAKGFGSNRKYSEIYNAAIEYGRSQQPNCYYFVDKIMLTKIEYIDIYHKNHVCYFMDKIEISKDSYDRIVSSSYDDSRFYSLTDISFPAIRMIVDSIHK